MRSRRGFAGIGILIATMLGLVVLGGGVYFVMEHNENDETQNQNTQTSKEDVDAWQTYSEHGFSFKYPNDWKILDVPAQGAPPPLVAVAPNDYVVRSQNDTGYFYVYELIDFGEPGADKPYPLDSGWTEDRGERTRRVDTKDKRFRILMVGGTNELESLTEKILSTFQEEVQSATEQPSPTSENIQPETTFTSATLTATPTVGNAPLTVSLNGQIAVPYNQNGSAVLFFGDGVSDVMSRSGPSLFNESWTHTYSEPGRYEATLVLSSVQNVDSDIQVMKYPNYSKNTIVKTVTLVVRESTDNAP